TGGTRLRVSPLVGYTLHRNQDVLARQRRMARAFGLPIIWGTDPNLEGRSLSVARDAGVPAIYAEYHGGGGCDPAGIATYVRGCLDVLAELDMIDAEPSAARPDPLIVEDDRPNSGHMQINHPAPCEGFFEPAVALGQRVEAGDLLGKRTDRCPRRRNADEGRSCNLPGLLHGRWPCQRRAPGRVDLGFSGPRQVSL